MLSCILLNLVDDKSLARLEMNFLCYFWCMGIEYNTYIYIYIYIYRGVRDIYAAHSSFISVCFFFEQSKSMWIHPILDDLFRDEMANLKWVRVYNFWPFREKSYSYAPSTGNIKNTEHEISNCNSFTRSPSARNFGLIAYNPSHLWTSHPKMDVFAYFYFAQRRSKHL